MLQKSDASAELPDDVVTAQRRVRRAVCTLAPPGNFSVLVEQLAAEMVHAGIVPGSPMFEPFLQMQIRALVSRVRGICDEQGVELDEEIEEDVPAAVSAPWWKRWRS